MKLKVLLIGCLVATTIQAQSFAKYVGYPSKGSTGGWSVTGNVVKGCFATSFNVPNDNGTSSGFMHTCPDSKFEPNEYAEMTVQSNGQNSLTSTTVSLPSTTNYKIAFAFFGKQAPAPLGGQNVYPKVTVAAGGATASFCKYPDNTSITATQTLLVDNHSAGIIQYAETCAMQLFAGNNSLSIQIDGGQGNGGQLYVGQVVIYETSMNLDGAAGCTTNGTSYNNSTQVGGDLFGLVTAARNWTNSICGTTKESLLDLANFQFGSSGCGGSANNCALADID